MQNVNIKHAQKRININKESTIRHEQNSFVHVHLVNHAQPHFNPLLHTKTEIDTHTLINKHSHTKNIRTFKKDLIHKDTHKQPHMDTCTHIKLCSLKISKIHVKRNMETMQKYLMPCHYLNGRYT